MRHTGLRVLIAIGAQVLAVAAAHAQQSPAQASGARSRPNILMIMADDVGYWNVSAYSRGMMLSTPNIDRIGNEGIVFTDHYAQPTCTPSRAAFITGQLPIRTGLTTVGLPGSPIGLDARDPTLAEVLKPLGYRSGQFGKNHLGDRNEHLPTAHGFDEFYGNLYHLNTEEEPMRPEWPRTPGFNDRYIPRGVLDCKATAKENPEADPRFGKFGKQTCKDTGPLTPERMQTVDDEFVERTIGFMERAKKDGAPFFVWHAPTRMHIYTHLRPQHRGRSFAFTDNSADVYADGMMELDEEVGKLLAALDRLGIADNTIVLFTTDNGAMATWWPDGGTTPFRGEKSTTWEGGVRVPMLVRWPARIAAGRVSNGIQEHMDLFTTLTAAAGVDGLTERFRKEKKVHLDGLDNLAHWTGDAPSARNVVYYYDESELTALRIGPWKSHFKTREGFFDYLKPSALIFNLRSDPFEERGGWKSQEIAMRLGVAWGGQVQDAIGAHLKSLKEFPPRQAGGSLRMGADR